MKARPIILCCYDFCKIKYKEVLCEDNFNLSEPESI